MRLRLESVGGRIVRIVATVTVLTSVSSPAGAQAPPQDPALVREGDALRAQKLFDEARELASQNRWSDACPKFRESLAADPGVGTLLNVASCNAREGKVRDAAREYRRVLELNQGTRDAERRKAVEAQARQALTELAARVGKIRVTVTPGNASARVLIDGQAAVSGAPNEVEVGAHTVRVEADGFRAADAKVVVVGEQDAAVAVALEPTESGGSAGSGPSGGLATAGWVTGLVGAGGLAVGAVLISLATDRAAAVRAECGPDVAPPRCPEGSGEVAAEIASEGGAFANGGYAALSIGGAALGAGIVMLIVDASAAGAPPVKVNAGAALDAIFVQVGGAF